MSDQHTPEPWYIPVEKPTSICENYGNEIMCNLGKDDAKRIVACVNALAGVPTSTVENSVTPFIEQLLNNERRLLVEIEQYKQQINALYKANSYRPISTYTRGSS